MPVKGKKNKPIRGAGSFAVNQRHEFDGIADSRDTTTHSQALQTPCSVNASKLKPFFLKQHGFFLKQHGLYVVDELKMPVPVMRRPNLKILFYARNHASKATQLLISTALSREKKGYQTDSIPKSLWLVVQSCMVRSFGRVNSSFMDQEKTFDIVPFLSVSDIAHERSRLCHSSSLALQLTVTKLIVAYTDVSSVDSI
jgi:hypothetical protein